MTLNYRMKVREEVGNSIPGFEIFSLLDGKTSQVSSASCATSVGSRPYVSKYTIR